MAENLTWLTRVRGMLLGLACGDALGLPFERRPLVRSEEVTSWAAASAPLRVSDDTILALTLAEHLAGHDGQIDQDALVLAFARAWRADPDRGYGGAVRDVFGQVLTGTGWREASGSRFGGTGSWGNGGAMRVAPAAMTASGLERVAALARRSAEVTHAHPEGRDGAAVQACAVALAAASCPGEPVSRETWCGLLASVVPGYAEVLERVAGLAPDASPEAIAAATGNSVRAVESVPAALAAMLAHPDDPGAAIAFAVRIAGDTDTIAAMTGALAGARCGASALPAAWPSRLEFAGRLSAAAVRLARLAERH